eukprot:TRINITY_DN17156_c0_g2_i3.p1 TRINITY_DN17156_c0_g2~~TRINITY_DN17156_c0_g2_i3.p1  ORF type:complete len:282 (+),score=51.68 TRINITY_DN17156_c0_g2_i3:133-978(+)
MLRSLVGSAVTHPMDLMKVRMQLGGAGAQHGLLSATAGVIRTEGASGLYKGLSGSLLRQFLYSGTRFGVYDIIREKLQTEPGTGLPLHLKVANGLVSGAVGAVVGNPADVALVRMQADGRLPAAERRNYKGVVDSLGRIAKEEGVSTWWRGCNSTVARAMIVTAGQLATYDQAKEAIVSYAGSDPKHVSTHLSASIVAGIVASVVSNPVDVVKTRLMNMQPDPATGQPMYRGPLDCIAKTVRSEGVLALQKGLGATMTRQCPYVVIMFLCQERIKDLLTPL